MAMQDIISEMLNEQIEMMADTGNAVKEGIYITVDPETRQMTIPTEYSILGVESDEKTERLWFKFPKVVGDSIDLTTLQLRVNYRNANSETDQYVCTDVTEADDGENIIFSWQLSRKVTKYQGNVVFIVCAVKVDDVVDGDIENEWNTTLAQAGVLEGLEVALSDEEEEEVSDIVAQLIAMMNQSANQAIESISDMKDTAIAAVQSQQSTSVGAVQQTGSTAQASIASDKATALSDIEEAKQNALNSIPDDYTALSELAEETYERMELSKAPIIRQEATGENIQLTDAGDAPIRRLCICGRSQQEKTNGYQLFDASKIPTKTQGGATVTNNGDGSFTISGSGTLSDSFTSSYSINSKDEIKKLFKNGNIYSNGVDKKPQFYIYGTKDDGGIAFNTATYGSDVVEDVESLRTVLFVFYSASGETITPVTFKPMVYQDGTGEWEPYTGGKPSPSPEYPQQIKSVGIDTANYFDKNNVDETKCISGSNGVLEWNKDSSYALSNLVPVYPGQWITKGQTGSARAGFVGEDGNLTRNINLADGGSVQAQPGEKYFCCNVVKTSNLNTAIINYGKTLHPYKEYGVKGIEVNVLSKSTNLIDYREVKRFGEYAVPHFVQDGFIVSGKWYAKIAGVKVKKGTRYNLSFKSQGTTRQVGVYKSGTISDENRIALLTGNSNQFDSGDYDLLDFLFYAIYSTSGEGVTQYTEIMLNEGQEALPYQPYGQSHYTINLTNQLRGIPVSSGGNYTDEEGQQYICDEIQIDQETKTGVYIQRVGEIVLDGKTVGKMTNGADAQFGNTCNYAYITADTIPGGLMTNSVLQSNILSHLGQIINVNATEEGTFSGSAISIFLSNIRTGITVGDIKETKTIKINEVLKQFYNEGSPLSVNYVMSTPTITKLTETQIEDLLSLYTYSTATEVYTEQEENSIQGGLEIQYGADTKKYIDDKIQAIAQQVLSLSTQE